MLNARVFVFQEFSDQVCCLQPLPFLLLNFFCWGFKHVGVAEGYLERRQALPFFIVDIPAGKSLSDFLLEDESGTWATGDLVGSKVKTLDSARLHYGWKQVAEAFVADRIASKI